MTGRTQNPTGALRTLVSYLPVTGALAVVLGVGIFAEQQNREVARQAQRTAVIFEVEALRGQLESAIGTQFEVLARLSGALAADPLMSQDRFADVAAALVDDPMPIRTLTAVPSDGRAALVAGPPAAAAGAVAAMLADVTGPRPGARSLPGAARPSLVFWDPVTEGVPPAPRGVWGHVAAIVDIEALFTAAGLRDASSDLDLTLTSTEPGSRGRKLHLGNAGVLSDDPVSAKVAMPGGEWALSARPRGGWQAAGESVWPIRILMLLSLVLVSAPMLRTRRLVAERQSHIRDLHDREARLQETSQRLSLALDASRVAVWDYNIDAEVLIWDARMDELYGYPHDGRRTYADWRKRLHPEDIKQAEADFDAAIHDTGRYNSEYRIVLEDGHVRHIRAIAAVYRTPEGQSKIVGVNWDVTSEVLRSVELEARRAEAEAALNAKSQFLATMSHEIRTPMTGVIGMLDLLLRENLSGAQRDRAMLVRDSARHLLNIVNDVLDFSKLEADRFTLEALPVDVGQLANDVVTLLAAGNAKQGLRVFASIDADVPDWIESDPTRLRQILTNLVGNAVKFTDAGTVELHLSYDPDDGGILRFAVRDTGTGISEDARDRIFERFHQADAAVTRERGGTGLGLAICKQLVERMGGELTVDSVLGLGSTFSLWIPAPRSEPAILAPADASAGNWSAADIAAVRAARILVADDNPANRQVLAGYLEMAGHEVRFAGDGAEAVRLLKAHPFDLVIMDVHMPLKDGVSAACEIRALGGVIAAVPIIALTGDLGVISQERFRAAGMTDHILKPVTVDTLFSAIDRAGIGHPSATGDQSGPGSKASISDAVSSVASPRSAS